MKAKKKPGSFVETPRATAIRPVYCFAIVTAVLAYIASEAYGPALHGPFVYDDFSLPYYNRSFPVEQLIAWIRGVRPLLMFSYWINFQLSGRDTYSYHVLNLLLHLGNAAAVYFIARRVLAWEVLDRSRREILAVFAATLFLFHPIQTESVAWIAGRSESLSALFYLCAFAVFLYRPSDAIGWRRSAFVLLLATCAMASKEHTATLPIVLLLTDVWWEREDQVGAVRRNWRLYLPMLCGGLVAARVIWSVVGGSKSAGFHGTGVSPLAYALTQCRVFFVYLRLFLFPVGQNLDYDMPWSPSHFEFATLAGFLGIVTLAVVAWRMRRRFPVGSYGFLLFLILLAPTTSFIPIKDPIAERRLYLPMLGLVLAVCGFLIHTIRERTSLVAFASVVIAAASVTTYHRSRLWGSESALWEDTIAKSPNKIRGYAHLVHGLVLEHRCREAIQRLEDLSRRMTIDPPLLGHWAVAYECVHEPEQALAKLALVAAQAPTALTYVDIARNQLELERVPNAIESLNQALKMDPTVVSAYLMRGEVYERLGGLLLAAQNYRQALELNPKNQQAQWHLQQISRYTLHQ